MWLRVAWVAVLCLASSADANVPAAKCVPKNVVTCSDCLASGGYCAWCRTLNFTRDGELDSVRCASVEALKARGCEANDIMNPMGSFSVLQNEPLTSTGMQSETVVQLSPQKVHVKLRPGIPTKFDIKFKRAEGYPIDLYYLMDLSYSMNDDLENVKKLGSQLLQSLGKITKGVKIGFGAFVDKTVLPYVSTSPEHLEHPCTEKNVRCSRPFAYKHVLTLTDKSAIFEKKVGDQIISGNLDTPEGGFDAMLQAAVCGDKIGWRNNTRLLVFTSDAGFHFAGDGKLAGIVTPNDGNCHLDSDGEYKDNIHYDYPSVGQLAQKLSENNIQPIFAVTKSVVNIYRELSQLIPKSAVGELSGDSSNVIQLITSAYNNLSSKIILEPSRVPEGVSVSFVSHCNNKEKETQKGVCSEVKIGTEILFTVAVLAKECPKDTEVEFEIRSLGFQEKLSVKLSFECQCNCNDSTKNAPYCSNGNGNLECGVCSCHQDRIGRLCDCRAKGGDTIALEAQCRPDNSSQLCSGQGDCVCGKCVCNVRADPQEKVDGKYCHCNNFNCERYDNKLCGGNGECVCGKCQCFPGFHGDRCECPLATDGCVYNNRTCNGQGVCKCNKCQCTNSSYSGSTCEVCLTCTEQCEQHKECAQCLGFKDGMKKDSCDILCPHTHNMVQNFEVHDKQCVVKVNAECNMVYRYSDTPQGKLHFTIKDKLECRVPPNVAAIVGGSVGGILIIGIVLLLLWKSYITWKDKKDFARFEKERHNAKWNDGVNPIYKSATTTVVNPRFAKN
ncbi:integrin beta-1-B-like [Petromyzon marinus]|uniref:integrin beta-1-B-like n=1 Tax=Petromyzon marinus TaxID=7757 RepID=UPI003F6F8E2E